jgi:hypothetical protein
MMSRAVDSVIVSMRKEKGAGMRSVVDISVQHLRAHAIVDELTQ